MGAQKAAWQAGFQAEAAALATSNYAQALLDLVKAFEKVPHDVVLRLAAKHEFNRWLVRLSLASYRLARTIGIDGSFSRLIVATRGITAGSVFATTELRIIMMEAMDETLRIWPSICLSVYVDDCTLESSGPGTRPAAIVAGATDTMVGFLERVLRLEVSTLKSVAAGSAFSLARRTARMSASRKLSAVKSAKLLGTPAAGGRRRCTAPYRARVMKVRVKAKRLRILSRSIARAKTMVRAAGTPALTYGWDVMGVADAPLKSARSLIAAMLSSDPGGKSPDATLMLNDASGGTSDPAYDAHCLCIKHWAMAVWERWQPPQLMEYTFAAAAERLHTATRTPWDMVTGPASALIATLWRLGWCVLSPTTFVDDHGLQLCCSVDPPAFIADRAKESVRRWQGRKVLDAVPGAIPLTPDFAAARPGPLNIPERFQAHPVYQGARLPTSIVAITAPLGRLTGPKRCRTKLLTDYGFVHRPWLRSAVAGGQWPQVRVAAANDDGDIETCCQLCRASPGTLQHRAACEATVPEGGWPAPPPGARHFMSTLSNPRKLALSTRGLLGLWLPPPLPNRDGWISWVLGDPAALPADTSWYVDGSCFDAALPGLASTGFGAVATDPNGEIIAIAYGRPPEFVRNAPGAEAWALRIVLANAVQAPCITTDCLGLVAQVGRGLDDATASWKPLARVWKLIATSLDFRVPHEWATRDFKWMPAHTTRAAVGVALRSDGRPVSYLDWRTNRVVDKVAKAAAARGRAPLAQRQLVTEACQAVEFSAALLGMTTHAANNYVTTEWRPDGSAHSLVRRDSQPPAYLARGRGTRPKATGPRAPPPALPAPAPARAQRDAENTRLEQLHRARLDHQKAAKTRAKQATEQHEDAQEARALATWHLDKAAAAAPERQPGRPTAAQRLEALRLRVVARSAGTA